eukprot:9664614-Alexandrium_andersonii.AAC.1
MGGGGATSVLALRQCSGPDVPRMLARGWGRGHSERVTCPRRYLDEQQRCGILVAWFGAGVPAVRLVGGAGLGRERAGQR